MNEEKLRELLEEGYTEEEAIALLEEEEQLDWLHWKEIERQYHRR